jgi:hypothetical protein
MARQALPRRIIEAIQFTPNQVTGMRVASKIVNQIAP